ncbi:unnamed protein product [Adineta steineri]|uniref:Innexin n=1 Tax=Adineta steineri TaxID=433720 RepID=A0A815SVL7_9BILA|nr:unnamed protein product [Adineta steineri]CAF1643256.1 unnamed protein product [Adineta steineri]
MKVEIETAFIYKSLCQVDADVIDRLNSRYTTFALIGCFLIIAAKIYVGNPINCWTPTQFQSIHSTYVNSICWLKGTYYLPTEEIKIPDRSVPRMYLVSYYQWTSPALVLMALLFTLPGQTWQTFSYQSGLDGFVILRIIGQNIDELCMIQTMGYLCTHYEGDLGDDDDNDQAKTHIV